MGTFTQSLFCAGTPFGASHPVWARLASAPSPADTCAGYRLIPAVPWRLCVQAAQSSRTEAQAGAESSPRFTSPKTGAVGEVRLRKGAAPGTYWSQELAASADAGSPVTVEFNTGLETVSVQGKVGENLLQLAEKCGVLKLTEEFCFEGTCCHCEVEVEGGAAEVGYRALASPGDLVRSCICPVPPGKNGVVKATILSEEGAWGQGVL